MESSRSLDPWHALLTWAELLVVLILYSAVTGAFGAGVTIALSWAWRLSYGVPAIILLGTWVLIAIPTLYAQVAMITDAVGRVLTDYVGIVPHLLEPPQRWPLSPLLRLIVWMMSLTSPLGGASALCLYSVTDVGRPFDIIRLKARAEIDVTGLAIARIRTTVSR